MARSLKLASALVAALAFSLLVATGAQAAESLQVTTIPATPTGGSTFTVDGSGVSDTGGALYVFVQPASDPCRADSDSEAADPAAIEPITGPGVGPGAFDSQSDAQLLPHGSYLLCGYVSDDNSPPAMLSRDSRPLTIANADTLTIAATTTPAFEGDDNALHLTGFTDQDSEIDMSYKPVAQGGCAPTAAGDNGTRPDQSGIEYDTQAIDLQTDTVQFGAGRYQLCGWIEPIGDPAAPPIATAATVLDVQAYSGSLTLDVPWQVAAGYFGIATIRYQVNHESEIFAAEQPANRKCAATVEQDKYGNEIGLGGGSGFDTGSHRSGQLTADVSAFSIPGRYRVCAWLESIPVGNTPVGAGPFTQTFKSLKPGQMPQPNPKHGKPYKARTSQRQPLVFAFDGSTLSDIAYEARYRCKGFKKKTSPQLTVLNPVRLSGKSFKESWKTNFDRGTFKGTLHGKTVKGTLTETYQSVSGSTCKSGLVRFKAKPR